MIKFNGLLVTAAFFSVLLINSCAKDVADQPSDVDCSTVDAATNTYNLRIKTIMDNNCAMSGCHDNLTKESGVNLSNYAGTKTGFVSADALCTIKQEQGCVPMPDSSPKLADSLITYIQCWSENGYPE